MTSKRSTYWEKLRDPRWQKKRLRILEASNFECAACGDGTETLHVHHRYYERARDPWDYPDSALVALCEGCHQVQHSARKMLDLVVASIPSDAWPEEIVSLLAGFVLTEYGTTDRIDANVRAQLLSIGEQWGYKDAFSAGMNAARELERLRFGDPE